MSTGGLFGAISGRTLFRFAVFIILVWLAVDLGIVLAGILPMPVVARQLMAPSLGSEEQQHAMTLG